MTAAELEPAERLILDGRFLVDLLFKPDLSGLRLPPHLTQMLLKGTEAILWRMQDEGGDNLEEEPEDGDTECK